MGWDGCQSHFSPSGPITLGCTKCRSQQTSHSLLFPQGGSEQLQQEEKCQECGCPLPWLLISRLAAAEHRGSSLFWPPDWDGTN